MPAIAGFFLVCSFSSTFMSTTFDFKIIAKTQISGMSLVIAQNEDAFSYLTDELAMPTLPNGSAPVFSDNVGDFISDAEHAHLCCEYI